MQALNFVDKMSAKKMTFHDIRHFLRESRSSMLDQVNYVTQAEYNECPACLSQHVLRAGRAGVGWKNAAVARHKLQLACDWMSRGLTLFIYNSSPGMLETFNAV